MDISALSSSFKTSEARTPSAAPAAGDSTPAPAQDSVQLTRVEAPAPKTVKVSYNPQDSAVMTAGTMDLPAANVGKLANSRIKLDEPKLPTPDAQGNYITQPGTKEFHQTSAFASTEKTLRLFEQAVGHEIKWNFSGPLEVHPHAGDQFNAYYSPRDGSTNFCGEVDKVTKKRVEASESMEVVSHETGHALLDGMRPGLLGWFSGAEAGAFHEAFGDIAAIVTSMQDDRVLDRLVEQTGGDLRKENIVARMGEELSQGINHNYYDNAKPANWTIRNANNALTYKSPSSLPSNPADETQLGSEVHNFSRLWTGACFEMMAEIANKAQKAGATPKDAFIKARDAMLKLTALGVELGPDRMKRYSQMAAAMLKADQRYLGGEYKDIVTSVFNKRKIGTTDQADLSAAAAGLKAGTPPRNFTEAAAWLATHRDQMGLPEGITLEPQKVVKNAAGETLTTYGYVQEVPIGDRYATDLAGSLTVGFDKDGAVFHTLFEPVDDEQIALATETITAHVANGEVRGIAGTVKSAAGAPQRAFQGEVVEGERKGILADRIKIARIPYAE